MSRSSLADPSTPLAEISRDQCHRLDSVLTREWLETDGRGGYAMGTPLLCPTRRYHGLLVAPPPDSSRRHLFLSRFEETIHGGGRSFPLSMARYPGLWAPHGHGSIETFRLVPYPSFVYRIGRAEIVREILMVRGAPTVICRYRVSGQQTDVTLKLRPLLPYREADSLTYENLDLDPRAQRLERGIVCRPYRVLPAISITMNLESRFEADPVWYRRLTYEADVARGYDSAEDQFSPGATEIPLEPGVDLFVAATIGDAVDDPEALFTSEASRRQEELAATPRTVVGRLGLAAENYLYQSPAPDGGDRTGVLAGFPWFGEWGRDTFIALPGLTLARGQLDRCAEVLSGALPYLRDGLLPNVYEATPEQSSYNSVDAALWFARAVHLFERAGGDPERVLDEYFPALEEIGSAYLDGTRHGIRCDTTGLIAAGGLDLNLTWMDARTEDGPVTPRDGCAVEINALWYSLLRHLERLQMVRGDADRARHWLRRRRMCSSEFLRRFWLDDGRYLADVWKQGEVDRSIRPNMVIAAAMEYSPLSRGKRTDVVRLAQAELVTPRGLRTLAPDHVDYQGTYRGTPRQRDEAYHQGTVWPWLLGFFGEAWLRAYGWKPQVLEYVSGLIDEFEEHLEVSGLGQISEVFDGDPPHRPGGTVAQAWSVAELLRLRRLTENEGP